ncbi:hypothetical protein KUTeg_022869 [Tegillarca granosa]|uniref:Uncharacterized protein n=1 Tax=Tegillarca granosa TaxID=220873 RepID=A0ABQ9E0G9_TEGGR|nr:hypothetical protein KUTeg_022869 [Tegillarca granosa]
MHVIIKQPITPVYKNFPVLKFDLARQTLTAFLNLDLEALSLDQAFIFSVINYKPQNTRMRLLEEIWKEQEKTKILYKSLKRVILKIKRDQDAFHIHYKACKIRYNAILNSLNIQMVDHQESVYVSVQRYHSNKY